MSPSVRAIARNTLALAAAAVLGLGTLAAAAATSLDELVAMNQRAWGAELELLKQTYAPDGVHTATFYDRTNEYAGPEAIAVIAGFLPGAPETIGPRVDIPAADGEWRWATFHPLGGGSACLFHAVGGQIVRHDCVLPEASNDSRAAVDVTDDPATLEAVDELRARLHAAWGRDADPAALEAVYAPDAVHAARYLNRTRSYVGPAEIASVARSASAIEPIGEHVVFEAPEGELAWASVGSASGLGHVCIFRARDGMVFRHDCVVPVFG